MLLPSGRIEQPAPAGPSVGLTWRRHRHNPADGDTVCYFITQAFAEQLLPASLAQGSGDTVGSDEANTCPWQGREVSKSMNHWDPCIPGRCDMRHPNELCRLSWARQVKNSQASQAQVTLHMRSQSRGHSGPGNCGEVFGSQRGCLRKSHT